MGTEAALARSEPDALGTPISFTRLLITAFAIPLTFVVLFLAPVFVLRLRHAGERKVLDGYGIGALGAYCFVGASTLARLASQLSAGPVAEANRSSISLAVAAAIQGLAIPTDRGRGGGRSRRHPVVHAQPRGGQAAAGTGSLHPCRRSRSACSAISASGCWTSPRSASASRWRSTRCCRPRALRSAHRGALRAASGEARRRAAQRTRRPVRSAGRWRPHCRSAPTAESPATSRLRRRARPRPLLVAGARRCAGDGRSVGLSLWLTPPSPNYVCPPDCGRPPLRQPVATNPRFTLRRRRVLGVLPGRGHGVRGDVRAQRRRARICSRATAARSGCSASPPTVGVPRQIAEDVIKETIPTPEPPMRSPTPSSAISWATEKSPTSTLPTPSATTSRAAGVGHGRGEERLRADRRRRGSFREFSPDFGSGHPSGANFLLSLDMGKYVNSFMWKGDPPR